MGTDVQLVAGARQSTARRADMLPTYASTSRKFDSAAYIKHINTLGEERST